ncbi:hypothetical protein GOBAR_DD14330 [Gossypium barbadense]|nr:hypothetical protein GOBAR_DD14330 [Gossypium barbadense]
MSPTTVAGDSDRFGFRLITANRTSEIKERLTPMSSFFSNLIGALFLTGSVPQQEVGTVTPETGFIIGHR